MLAEGLRVQVFEKVGWSWRRLMDEILGAVVLVVIALALLLVGQVAVELWRMLRHWDRRN